MADWPVGVKIFIYLWAQNSRSFVLGRKNWLFAGAPNGADAAAAFFSLIETAKANGLIFAVYLNSNRYQNY
jgi:hypothetical protein